MMSGLLTTRENFHSAPRNVGFDYSTKKKRGFRLWYLPSKKMNPFLSPFHILLLLPTVSPRPGFMLFLAMVRGRSFILTLTMPWHAESAYDGKD